MSHTDFFLASALTPKYLAVDVNSSGNNTLVAIFGTRAACHQAFTDDGYKRLPHIAPAHELAVFIPTGLPQFRCVYAMKPDTLAGNFYGVAVDHAGLAGDVGQGWRRKKQRHRKYDKGSFHGPILRHGEV